MKLIFFGASRFVIPLIKMLNENFQLVLVVTTENDQDDIVPNFCKKSNIPYLSVKTIPEAISEIKSKHAELGVLAYFGLLLPKELLDTFPKGILNIHPSLLPKYRGATPVQTAILNGDSETGVTIIKLDEELDHGPILGQEKEEISPNDTTATLHDKLFTKGTEMLRTIIPDYISGKTELQDQKHEDASLTERNLTRQDGYIDLNSLEIGADEGARLLDKGGIWKLEIARKIRAYYPWPGAWTKIRIKNQEARIKLLPNNMVQMEGKKPVTLKDFMNGYPELKEIIGKLLEPNH